MKVFLTMIALLLALDVTADNGESITTVEQIHIKHSQSTLNKDWRGVSGATFILSRHKDKFYSQLNIVNTEKSLCGNYSTSFVKIRFKGKEYEELVNCDTKILSEINLFGAHNNVTRSLIHDKRISLTVENLGTLSFSAIGFQKAINKVFFAEDETVVKLPSYGVSTFGGRTGNEFISAKRDDKKYYIYLDEGVISTTAGTITSTSPRLACYPKGTTFGQINDVVVKYIENNPKDRHLQLTELITKALSKAFPC